MESGQGWKEIIQKRMYGAGSKCEVFSAGATDARANANASANVFDSTAKKKSLISFFVAAAVIHYWQQSFTQKSFPFWPQLQDCTLMVHYGTETAHSRCTLLNNSKLAETQCPANQRTSQQTQLPSHLPPWKKPSSVSWCSELDHSSLACPYWSSSFSSKKERHSCNQLWSTAAWNASSTSSPRPPPWDFASWFFGDEANSWTESSFLSMHSQQMSLAKHRLQQHSCRAQSSWQSLHKMAAGGNSTSLNGWRLAQDWLKIGSRLAQQCLNTGSRVTKQLFFWKIHHEKKKK